MKSPPQGPLVSVIMTVLNGAETVGAAIRSVQLQTLQDWEMIVVDNGSSDQTAAIIAGFDDARIRVIRESSTAWVAVRLNQAIALSRGQFIARMDCDDICFPQRLALQVARLQQDRQVDLLGCRAVVFTDDAALVGELPVGLTHAEMTARPFTGFPFPHPTWCGRAAWFRSNPYDSALMYAEDQDLLLRTYRHSRFAAVETVLFGYRQNQLALRKLLPGRRTFIKSLWRYGRHSGEMLSASAGIATHLLKGAVDIGTVGIGIGVNRLMQRQRLKPVPDSILAQWQELQAALRQDPLGDRDYRADSSKVIS
jgi:glycosyltransferase involved in cell wall biosynthesis